MQISKQQTSENPNYLGFDEDHDGNFDDFYQCPNEQCNDGYRYNYITLDMYFCPICGVCLEWIN